MSQEDPDDVIYLSLETVLNGFSVLIFCPTKQIVEATATKLSERFFEIGNPSSSQYPEIGEKLRGQLNGQRIKDLLEQLKHSPGGVDSALSKAVMFGIGFHHAGLTYENRDIIESGFKRGVLKVSTLVLYYTTRQNKDKTCLCSSKKEEMLPD